MRKEFPSEQLGFCVVARRLLVQILFISLDNEIKPVFNGRFQGQAGPRQIDVSKLDARLKCATPQMDWVSGCPVPLLDIFGYGYVIDLAIANFIW